MRWHLKVLRIHEMEAFRQHEWFETNFGEPASVSEFNDRQPGAAATREHGRELIGRKSSRMKASWIKGAVCQMFLSE